MLPVRLCSVNGDPLRDSNLVSGLWSLAQGREHSAKRIASRYYDWICSSAIQPHAPCTPPHAVGDLKPET